MLCEGVSRKTVYEGRTGVLVPVRASPVPGVVRSARDVDIRKLLFPHILIIYARSTSEFLRDLASAAGYSHLGSVLGGGGQGSVGFTPGADRGSDRACAAVCGDTYKDYDTGGTR